MADPKPTGSTKPPADPSKTYTKPHEEARSDATQAAADRHLHGQPTNPDGSTK
jgi:hypothetical protein